MAVNVYRQNTMDAATIGDNEFMAVVRETSFEVGESCATGVLAFIRNTYPASYNHVVRNMNGLIKGTDTKDKRFMRGGHFLLYRYVLLFAIVLCFAFDIASIYTKACAAVSFVLTVLYIALSIYNIVIFILNRPLMHPIFCQTSTTGTDSRWLYKRILFHTCECHSTNRSISYFH